MDRVINKSAKIQRTSHLLYHTVAINRRTIRDKKFAIESMPLHRYFIYAHISSSVCTNKDLTARHFAQPYVHLQLMMYCLHYRSCLPYEPERAPATSDWSKRNHRFAQPTLSNGKRVTSALANIIEWFIRWFLPALPRQAF